MVSGGTANLLAQERLDRQPMVHVPTEEILTQIDEDEVHAGSDRNMSEYTVNPRLQFMGSWSVAMLLPDR